MLLSNNDIKRELLDNKNIAIHPLKTENIKGSSINLTASRYAWDIKTKKTVVDEKKKKITIGPHSTACIFTEEAIWVLDILGEVIILGFPLLPKEWGTFRPHLIPNGMVYH